MNKKYTKKQITEAIAYWKKQLKMMNESADSSSSSTVKNVSLVALLDSFEVFDECASWSENTGASSYLTKFTGEAAQKIASVFSNEDKLSIKLLGIAKVMSAEEYAEYAEQHESDVSYDDYISNEIYTLEDTLSNQNRVCTEFKAASVLVVDNVIWEGKPGKTVLVVPYAVH